MDKLDCEYSADKIFPSEPGEEVCKQPLLLRNELPQIVSELVESCQNLDTFHHLNLVGLPSRGAVIEIVERLKKALFPGYLGEHEVDSAQRDKESGPSMVNFFK